LLAHRNRRQRAVRQSPKRAATSGISPNHDLVIRVVFCGGSVLPQRGYCPFEQIVEFAIEVSE
jgi:hypothetical protein